MTTQNDRQAVEAFLLDAIASLSEDEVSSEARLEELNIGSLDLIEIGQMVEEEYGLRLTADDLKGLTTVADTVDLVAARVH